MRYQLLLADADGTLFDFDTAEKRALKQTFDYCRVDYSEENIALYQKINGQLWKEYERGTITQQDIEDRRFEQWYAAITGENGRGDDIEQYYIQRLGEGADLLFGAEDFVKKVKEHMPIEIVTNGITSVQKSRLSASSIQPYISGLWISAQVGKSKPDPKMLHLAMEKHQIDKRKVILIGDSLKADIGAAQRAGIDCIWLTAEKKRNKMATYQCASLEEALKIVLG